jgi:hypothetical protein
MLKKILKIWQLQKINPPNVTTLVLAPIFPSKKDPLHHWHLHFFGRQNVWPKKIHWMLLLKHNTLLLLLQKKLYLIKSVHLQESKVSRLPRCVAAHDTTD